MRLLKARELLTADGGAVALEFAIISMAMVLLSLGTIEFGRAYQVRNELSFLADRAARQILNDSGIPDAEVEDAIEQSFKAGDPDLLEVDVVQDTEEDADGTTYRNIQISYPFNLLIPQISSRSITLSATERVPET